MLIWVDDILLAANMDALMKKIKDLLIRRFKMKDLGPISCFLGIRFRQEEGMITMDQAEYLMSKLTKFKMDACRPRTTPCEIGGYPSDEDVPFENIRLYNKIWI